MPLISGMPILVGHVSVPRLPSAVGEKPPPACAAAGDGDRGLHTTGPSGSRDQSLSEGMTAETLLFDPFPFPWISVFTQIFFLHEHYLGGRHLFWS